MPLDGTTYTDPVTDLLLTGRARIERRWIKNDWERERRSWLPPFRKRVVGYCLASAVDLDPDALAPLLHAIGAPFGDEDDIADWNDEPGRTRAEVLAVIDQAIAWRRAAP
jgi:hypothetical protein